MSHDRRQSDVEVALLRQEVEALQNQFTALRAEIKDLMDAFNTASGLLRVVKWLAVFIAGCAGSWSAWKGMR